MSSHADHPTTTVTVNSSTHDIPENAGEDHVSHCVEGHEDALTEEGPLGDDTITHDAGASSDIEGTNGGDSDEDSEDLAEKVEAEDSDADSEDSEDDEDFEGYDMDADDPTDEEDVESYAMDSEFPTNQSDIEVSDTDAEDSSDAEDDGDSDDSFVVDHFDGFDTPRLWSIPEVPDFVNCVLAYVEQSRARMSYHEHINHANEVASVLARARAEGCANAGVVRYCEYHRQSALYYAGVYQRFFEEVNAFIRRADPGWNEQLN